MLISFWASDNELKYLSLLFYCGHLVPVCEFGGIRTCEGPSVEQQVRSDERQIWVCGLKS